jgi:hypothetical protein
MGKEKGDVNWDKESLIKAVEEILPNGQVLWDKVVLLYQQLSGEKNPRDFYNLKRYWTETLCNKMMKPSGGKLSDSANDRLQRCQNIQLQVLRKSSSGILGNRSDDEDGGDEDDHEDEDEEEDEKDDFEADVLKGSAVADELPESRKKARIDASAAEPGVRTTVLTFFFKLTVLQYCTHFFF